MTVPPEDRLTMLGDKHREVLAGYPVDASATGKQLGASREKSMVEQELLHQRPCLLRHAFRLIEAAPLCTAGLFESGALKSLASPTVGPIGFAAAAWKKEWVRLGLLVVVMWLPSATRHLRERSSQGKASPDPRILRRLPVKTCRMISGRGGQRSTLMALLLGSSPTTIEGATFVSDETLRSADTFVKMIALVACAVAAAYLYGKSVGYDEGAQNKWHVVEYAEGEAKQTRTMATQSQCTYKWKWQKPEFRCLPAKSQGCHPTDERTTGEEVLQRR